MALAGGGGGAEQNGGGFTCRKCKHRSVSPPSEAGEARGGKKGGGGGVRQTMWTKFLLLFWKNWILQKRHKIQTIVELLIPVIFSLILRGIRNVSDTTRVET